MAKTTGVLPAEVTRVGVITQKRQSSMLMVFSVVDTEDRYSSDFIENYAKINLIPLVQRVPGVGDAASLLGVLCHAHLARIRKKWPPMV